MKRVLQIFTLLVIISLAFLVTALFMGDNVTGSAIPVRVVPAAAVVTLSSGLVAKNLNLNPMDLWLSAKIMDIIHPIVLW